MQTAHELILDAAGEGIYGLDKTGGITFGNAASTEILGWQVDDVRGKPAHDTHHHSHADGSPYPREECPIYAAINDGKVHRVDSEVFWHTDGTAVPIEYTSTPIMQDGKPTGAVVVFRDISQRREIERQREEAYAAVKALTEQLEQERDYLREEINVTVNFGKIIGESEALKRVLAHTDGLQGAPAHGLGVSPDGKTLWSTSKVYSHAYVHSLPDLREIGRVFVGQHPEWVTFTPDSKTVYIGAAGDNETHAIDVATMKEVATISVGQVPKRVATALMAVE